MNSVELYLKDPELHPPINDLNISSKIVDPVRAWYIYIYIYIYKCQISIMAVNGYSSLDRRVSFYWDSSPF